MKKFLYIYFVSLVFTLSLSYCNAQNTAASNDAKWIEDEHFDKKIKQYLNLDVPIISVIALQENIKDYTILDAREKDEYNLSHLESAIWIGYKKPQFHILEKMDKSKPVAIYCSIGYRSEKLGAKLENMGFEVFNVYGSIFEWVNKGFPVVDQSGKQTDKIHGYNKSWSKWIKNKNYKVIY